MSLQKHVRLGRNWGLLLLVSVSTPSFAEEEASPLQYPGYQMVWHDEFDGAELNTSVNQSGWQVARNRNSYNNEKQHYRPEQVEVVDGLLRITATDEPLDGKDYRSGRIWSWHEWTHGRFEARIKLPTTQGMWPAFWLNSRDADWPTGGEIDIIENRGSEPLIVSSAYHWGASVPEHQWLSKKFHFPDASGKSGSFHDSFHVYAAEWSPESIVFSVDGHPYQTITSAEAPIHDVPKSVVINLAIGGEFGGDPDDTTIFPQQLEADYVRVWQRTEVPVLENINPSFEYLRAALAGWQTFNEGRDNIQVVHDRFFGEGASSIALSGPEFGVQSWAGLFQSVPAEAGSTVRASVQSFVEPAWSGADDRAELKLEFYSSTGALIDSQDFLSEQKVTIADRTAEPDEWTEHAIQARVPDQAVEARIVLAYVLEGGSGEPVFLDEARLEVLPD